MRIIAGSLGGRQFDAPKGHRTHPMSEKARGGLFAALGDIEGLSVLDAFTGSGALSFEALSRGAKNALAIDIDRSAITTVVNSAGQLDLGKNFKAVRANCSGWSDNNPDQMFDLVLCDPPFDKVNIGVIQKLIRHIGENGILVVNLPPSFEVPDFDTLTLLKTKNYGDTTLKFYKKVI